MARKKEIVKKDKSGLVLKTYIGQKEVMEDLGLTKDQVNKAIRFHKEIAGAFLEYTGVEYGKDNSTEGKLKCPYCDLWFKNYNGLCKHIFRNKAHGDVSKEQLLTDTKYGGVRPTCKCGCGGYTTIINTNGVHFADYIQGHWNKIHNNWGHNPVARQNSAETRRRQYAEGTRQQWNKGKSWDEVYSQETQDRLRKNLIDKLHERVESSSFEMSSSIEKEFIEKFIDPCNIAYIRQYYISDIQQYCDVYLPSLNLVIEFNGSYWHCDRRIYNYGPINQIQRDKVQKDEIKYRYLRDKKINLLIVWEKDVKEMPEEMKTYIRNILSNPNAWKEDFHLFAKKMTTDYNDRVQLLGLSECNEYGVVPEYVPGKIYVFEDEWLYKREIVESRVRNALGITPHKIFARKCKIKEVTYEVAKIFLEENHLQGKITGTNYIGLFEGERMVSIMVFGKLRKNLGNVSKENEYELLRFCSVLDTNVVGAAGKLFEYFVKTYSPGRIISYSDNRWGNGVFYEKIGMKFSHLTQKNYYYVDELRRRRENRFSYRKDVLVSLGFDKNKTEREIMCERGFARIYDFGCRVYVWDKQDK